MRNYRYLAFMGGLPVGYSEKYAYLARIEDRFCSIPKCGKCGARFYDNIYPRCQERMESRMDSLTSAHGWIDRQWEETVGMETHNRKMMFYYMWVVLNFNRRVET